MYGGVDLSRFRYIPRKLPKKGPIRFLAVGRFVSKKGFDDLIDAFAILRKKYKNVHLTLIGEGESLSIYRRKIRKYRLQNHVHIKPWVNYHRIQNEYYRAHIFCAPSKTDSSGNQEGIPNTLKEAMATGMPCIATSHAGIPEIMKNGKTGVLVQEGNIKQLSNAMKTMISKPKSWKQFGLSARLKIVKDFNLVIQLSKQKSYYDQLLIK